VETAGKKKYQKAMEKGDETRKGRGEKLKPRLSKRGEKKGQYSSRLSLKKTSQKQRERMSRVERS